MTQPTTLSASLLRGLLWAALLAPAALHLALLPQYGRLQRDDYYGVLSQLFEDDGAAAEPGAWWRAHINFHRVAVPALIWGANVGLFDGHNLPTALLGLVCLGAIALLLARRMPAAAPEDGGGARAPPETWLLPAAMVSVLVLQPIAGHTLGRSFSAIHTYLAALFAVTVLVVLWHRAAPDRGPLWPLWPLAVLGPLTFSSELVTWAAAVAGALLLRLRRRDLVAVVGAAGLAAATYLVGRPPPAPTSLPEPQLFLGYVGVFLGAPFSNEVATARVVGWSLLALSVTASAIAFARATDRGTDRRLPAFWATVMLYGAGNGALAALGRASRFGENGALSVRYSIYPALFLLATAATLICASRRRRRATWAVAAALAVALVPVYRWGLRVMEIAVEEGRRQPVAELALRLGVEDPRYVSLASSNEPYLFSTVPLLEALGHVPFDRPTLRLPGPVVLGPAELAERELGRLGRVAETLQPELVYVAGWVERTEGSGGEVLFLDAYGRRTSAISTYRPIDEPKTLRWEGFALWQPADGDRAAGPGTAFVQLARDGRRVALGTSQRAREQIARIAVPTP